MAVQTQGRLSKFAGSSTLEVEICANCGVLFAAPAHMLAEKRHDGSAFYCPSGHSLSYDGDRERLKRELEEARNKAARERAWRDQSEASLRATKGVVTKQRKQLDRIAKGVCPCCNRSFADVRKHMQTKHPDFVPAKK